MKMTNIYQTLEDRGNYDEIEEHGPYFCSKANKDGTLKKGIKEPWLGEGYYFWDTFIEDAHWWGKSVYKTSGYVICHTVYNQHSELLYDTVADLSKQQELLDCAKLIKLKRGLKYVTFPLVLAYLREKAGFNFKAIRVHPDPKNREGISNVGIEFPGGKARLIRMEKIQICFFDLDLLTHLFKIVYPKAVSVDFTI